MKREPISVIIATASKFVIFLSFAGFNEKKLNHKGKFILKIMEKNDLDEDTTTSVEAELELISKPEVNLNSSINENIISLE